MSSDEKLLTKVLSVLSTIIPGQPKKCYPGGKFPGINPKNLSAAFGGQKIFSLPLSPRGRNCQKNFTCGIPMDYSQGSFQKKILLPLTLQGSFSEKFKVFCQMGAPTIFM